MSGAPDLLRTSPPESVAGTLLLAHGAGAPMDSAWMEALAAALTAEGLAVARFEFAYMAARRTGARKPPPRAETLVAEYRAALATLLAEVEGPVLIGGKSLGGRVATMLAAETLDRRVVAVVAFGYPFHPPGAPDQLRLAPLAASRLPVLIHQGTRDPFGSETEVAGYDLGPGAVVRWYGDGDHDLAPRKASGHSLAGHLASAAVETARRLRPT